MITFTITELTELTVKARMSYKPPFRRKKKVTVLAFYKKQQDGTYKVESWIIPPPLWPSFFIGNALLKGILGIETGIKQVELKKAECEMLKHEVQLKTFSLFFKTLAEVISQN